MSRMKSKVFGLEEFGLTVADLKLLGETPIGVRAFLSWPKTTQRIQRLEPEQRRQVVGATQVRKLSRIQLTWPDIRLIPIGPEDHPTGLSATVPARDLGRLSRTPGIQPLFVQSVKDHRKARPRKPKAQWYSVRALVALEVEDQVKVYQTLEDRIVMLKATSFEPAERRLSREWALYARPYLNSDWHLVRWKLHQIVDVYLVGEIDELVPTGIEVWSSLDRKRGLTPELAWHPRGA